MKLLTIVGARPQFIKAAALSRAVAARDGVEEIILHTGQHYDHGMSDVFFEELSIPKPQINLGIAEPRQGAMTGKMLAGIEDAIITAQPDIVVLYGDTNSTLAGALAAAKLHVPVAHIEAGLRSFNMAMPEEVNRILTDRISRWLFCPTQTAMANLAAEGFGGFGVEIANVGDIMLDVARFYAPLADTRALPAGLEVGHFLLATIHRAENTDDPARLLGIMEDLAAVQAGGLPVLYPIHPRTRARLAAMDYTPRVHLVDPVGYLDMIRLTRASAVIATDSGGLQKEAYFHQRPCITIRTETEWVELVTCGANLLTSPDTPNLVAKVAEARALPEAVFETPFYGIGQTAEAVLDALGRPAPKAISR